MNRQTQAPVAGAEPGEILLQVGGLTKSFRIGEKDKRKTEVADKLVVRFQAVLAHAEDDRVQVLNLIVQVAEAAGFLGAARRVITGVEVDDDLLAGIVLDRMLLSVAALQRKRRRLFPFECVHNKSFPFVVMARSIYLVSSFLNFGVYFLRRGSNRCSSPLALMT